MLTRARSRQLWPTVLLALSLAACAGADGEPDTPTATSDISAASTQGGQTVARIYWDTVRARGTIDPAAATRLSAFLKGTEQADAKSLVKSVVDDPTARLTPDARSILVDALDGKVRGDVPLDNAVYQVVLGNDPKQVLDDQLFLKGTGTLRSNTGITGHSRGYAKKADGVLRSAHGSRMPATAASPASVATPPSDALDAAAKTFGLALPYGFGKIASANYDPRAQYWEGICHAWTYSSLDERLNVMVDPDGPVGRRGVWIFGQWVSRADLGNWMMGVSNALSVADAELVDPFVEPVDIVKGIAEYVMTGRRGLRVDIWNDAERGRSEVWNQPLVGASMSVDDVSPTVRDAVLGYVRAANPGRPLPTLTGVKLVRITAQWGAEVSDDHEGPVDVETLDWNMYLATEASGRVAAGAMAHHVARKVGGLPVSESDALPDYFAYPKHELVDQALAGKPSRLLDNALEGPAYRFFVGTVLARGIPDVTRDAFEREARVAAPDVAGLRSRYPGIANAYSPEQWRATFEPKLGPGATFGAVWGKAAAEFPREYLAR